MNPTLARGLAAGVVALRRWIAVLDRINVFPVADGDTGRNLALSLAPLAAMKPEAANGGAANEGASTGLVANGLVANGVAANGVTANGVTANGVAANGVTANGVAVQAVATDMTVGADPAETLLLAARGNSGNIASQFLSAWLEVEALGDLPAAVSTGRDRARAAVGDPQPGTMLTLFDRLQEALQAHPPAAESSWVVPVVETLSSAVLETRAQQARNRRAGVVDAGALGMWIVFERCLRRCVDSELALPTLAQRFGPYLQVHAAPTATPGDALEGTANASSFDDAQNDATRETPDRAPNAALTGVARDATLADAPDATLADAPDATLADAPDATLADAPDAALADAPDAALADAPDAALADAPDAEPEARFCVDAVLRVPRVTPGPSGATMATEATDAAPAARGAADVPSAVSAASAVGDAARTEEQRVMRLVESLGESTVTIARGELVKVHLHANDLEEVRARLAELGEVVQLNADDLQAQGRAFAAARQNARVHLLTDAAGTFTADDAARYGVTVLPSYIQLGESSVPELQVVPGRLFAAMHRGERVSTSQASTAERHQRYREALARGQPVVYLAVGSAFTGNVEAAERFRREALAEEPASAERSDRNDRNDRGDRGDRGDLGDRSDCGDNQRDENERPPVDHRFTVIDSGAASGRLGVVALATARLVQRGADRGQVLRFVDEALQAAREWVFLDQLKYLARGGRLSRPAAFFGDALRMKPVVSPQPTGAEKVGTVRRARDQLPFALARLDELPPAQPPALLLVQHTDNRDRLHAEILPALRRAHPNAEILVRRLSLTTAVHTGPGTWALACLPALPDPLRNAANDDGRSDGGRGSAGAREKTGTAKDAGRGAGNHDGDGPPAS